MHFYVLLVCIIVCLKLVLRYKFVILGTHHPDTLYLREQGCEDPWLFFEAKRGPWTKKFKKHWYKPLDSFKFNMGTCEMSKNSTLLKAKTGQIRNEA
jgi:hypothetical protein